MLESDKELIKTLWESGQTISQIVQMLPYEEKVCNKMIITLKKQGVLSKANKNSKKEKIVNAYNSGITNPYTLSEMYGVPKYTIDNIFSACGIKRQRPKKNYKERAKTSIDSLSEKTQNIIEALNDNIPAKKIAEMYDVRLQWIYSVKRVHIKGIKRRKYNGKSN